MAEVRNLWAGAMLLGEGPVWDARADVLWFVDIKRSRVHRCDPATGCVDGWDAPATVGWVLPAEGGALVAGLRHALARFDPADGSFAHLADVEQDLPGNRLNDATVAPDGAIWFGTMDDGEREATGRVYRFDGRAVTAAPTRPAVVTNGPAFSPDGRILYHVDSERGLIHAVHVAADGKLGAGHVFARIGVSEGHPDGVTVDCAGNVWVGLWQGWCARLYAPDGSLIDEVAMPVANVTKVALGGPNGRTAYVTTARAGLDEETLAIQPEAGSLYAFEVEVPGKPLPLARLR